MHKSLFNQSPQHGRITSVDHHADLQVLKRIRKFLLPNDFTVSASLMNEMAQGYDVADPPVDELLAQGHKIYQPLLSQLRPELLHTNKQKKHQPFSDHLLNDPQYLALKDQFAVHPKWYDPKLAKIGAMAYRRYPLMLIWLLRNVALMAGYSIPALSIPLIRTGALVHDALPRLMRTYAYILAVSEHPDLNEFDTVLDIGSEGWRQSIMVRQIHGLVRRKLIADGWDANYWGVPINQTDTVATHLQFSLLIMRGLKLLGARISTEESQGILHLWQLASWWLGVDLNRLPTTEQDCWAWLYTYLATQKLDFAVGKPLAKALHDLPSQIMGEENRRGQFVELVNASVTRTLVGDDIGDGLNLPKSRFRQGVLVSVPILFGLDTARKYNRTVANKLEAFRMRRQDRMNWWLKDHDDYYK